MQLRHSIECKYLIALLGFVQDSGATAFKRAAKYRQAYALSSMSARLVNETYLIYPAQTGVDLSSTDRVDQAVVKEVFDRETTPS